MTLALLRDAAADQHGVWIGYADGEGRATRMLFYPKRIDGGRAVGIVDGSNIERAFSIHRITGAALRLAAAARRADLRRPPVSRAGRA